MLNEKVKDKRKLVEEIMSNLFISNPNVSSRQYPTKFIFKDKIPMTAGSKEDFKAIENEPLTGEEITVTIDETNISVNTVSIK